MSKIKEELRRFKPFQCQGRDLVCMSTNDVLPEKTKNDLLSVKESGKDIVTKLMKERFCGDNPSNCYVTIKKKSQEPLAQ